MRGLSKLRNRAGLPGRADARTVSVCVYYSSLVRLGLLSRVYYYSENRDSSGLQAQSELFLQRGDERRACRIWRSRELRWYQVIFPERPLQSESVSAGESGLVLH